MGQVLKGLSVITIVLAIIVGIVQANQSIELLGDYYDVPFRWGLAFTWWVSGVVTGILVYAFGVVVDHLQDMSYSLRIISSSHETPSQPAPSLGSSKASMDKLKGFKI
ncbi:hypothetical protein COLU111180_06155 [Cohnella lubricantis]|uniref:Uncharacterized protein n=1 Tax=Cohnella lubricantis TaxID=2163172 RepID=A0A841TBY8_9BACL|nr:hypothetical protein [Cohnella lubricantis]MBB6677539.1 hypothetical protein [Cohnella lubricantis]MBP2116575.1 hypothetical protein [Cohnella lubricantis]